MQQFAGLKLRWIRLALVVLVGLIAMPAAVRAATSDPGPERITSFAVDISIDQDAGITVTETITAVALGQRIRRGIYRDIPTMLAGPRGLRQATTMEILSVTRNHLPTPYFTESIGDEAGTIRINFGDDTFLQHGRHVFQLVYRSHGQLRFFQDYDELYWNVTGNDWEFVIENASCTVNLPPGASLVQQAAYTGPRGAQGRNFSTDLSDLNRPRFFTTQPLQNGHGLTVAVAWPKGHVAAPTTSQTVKSLLRANLSPAIGLLGILLLFAYYCYSWNAVGRDPAKGTIIPLFHPPAGLSPAALRVVSRMGFDNQAFAASVINMAVKGFLTITEEKKGLSDTYSLIQTGKSEKEAGLSRGEAVIARNLFPGGLKAVKLTQSSNSRLRIAREALRRHLYMEHEKVHFLKNRSRILAGGAITLITLAFMVFFAPDPVLALFWSVWVSFFTVFVMLALLGIVNAFRSGRLLRIGFSVLFALPFVLLAAFFLGSYANATASYASALAMVILVGVNAVFYVLMKSPTFEGRRLMDEIEGFKMFLNVAEKDRLDMLHAPEVTPDIFERYLSYALALDVENRWAARFEQAMADAGRNVSDYSPSWYRGKPLNASSIGAFAGSFSSSFSSAMSSSSSSGSGGGGSSGGGGGGGGGGGR